MFRCRGMPRLYFPFSISIVFLHVISLSLKFHFPSLSCFYIQISSPRGYLCVLYAFFTSILLPRSHLYAFLRETRSPGFHWAAFVCIFTWCTLTWEAFLCIFYVKSATLNSPGDHLYAFLRASQPTQPANPSCQRAQAASQPSQPAQPARQPASA